MSIEHVGMVGWRGMVGSVLLERMRAEGDFAGLDDDVLLHQPGRRPGPGHHGANGSVAARRASRSPMPTTLIGALAATTHRHLPGR